MIIRKNRVLVLFIASTSLIILLSSGLVRNDVPVKEYLDFAQQHDFDCVGTIGKNKVKMGGSCVLISPKHVLTAAHLSVFNEDSIYCKFGDKYYQVRRFAIHPRYIKGVAHTVDLALIELEANVKGISYAGLNKEMKELGEKAAIIGYGTFGIAGMMPTPRTLGVKVGGLNSIDSLGNPDRDLGKLSVLYADFDKPGDKDCCNSIKSGSPKPLRLEFSVNGGDSGGGLFIKQNGKWLLAGITHSTSNFNSSNGYGYGMIAGWMRVSVYQSWIEATIRSWDKEEGINESGIL